MHPPLRRFEDKTGMFPQRVKTHFLPVVLRCRELRRMPREESRRLDNVVCDAMCVALDETLQLPFVFAGDPARKLVPCRREPRVNAVFVLEAVRNDFQLQLTDCAQKKRAAGVRSEYLNRAFFSQLRESGPKLLAANRIGELDRIEDFR